MAKDMRGNKNAIINLDKNHIKCGAKFDEIKKFENEIIYER